MATQWQAGLTSYSKLPAATLNTIGAAWEIWTPTISAASGTFTTVTVNQAKYGRIQKIIFGKIDVTVVNNGTAAGALEFTLPITGAFAFSGNGDAFGVCREVNATGNFFYAYPTSTVKGRFVRYDNAYGLGNNSRLVGTFMYEAA